MAFIFSLSLPTPSSHSCNFFHISSLHNGLYSYSIIHPLTTNNVYIRQLNQSMHDPATFSSLPPEVLCMIMYLTTYPFIECARTCQFLYTISEPCLWPHLKPQRSRRLLTPKAQRALTRNARQVRELRLTPTLY